MKKKTPANDNRSPRQPSRQLTAEDAKVIWLRAANGEFQNRIAKDLDVNPGRVNEVLKGHRFPDLVPSAFATKPAANDNNRSYRKRSHRLTQADAVEIWLDHWDGHYQNRIANRFDVNPGRVNEVLKGHKFPEAKAMAERRRSAA